MATRWGVSIREGVFASRPVTGFHGLVYAATDKSDADAFTIWVGSAVDGEWSQLVPAPVGTVATVPGAYPYTTVDTDEEIAVDSTGGARTIVLKYALSETELVVIDNGDNSLSNPITVSVESGRKLNGATDGTLVIATNGALRGFKRNALGQWRGGV